MDRVNCILKDKEFLEYLKRNEEAEIERIFCHHDIAHFLDVCRIATIIKYEKDLNIGKDLIYAAGLLHDIGRWVEYKTGEDHAMASGRLAEPILRRCDYTETEIGEILLAIKSHRGNEHKTDLSNIIYQADEEARACFRCDAKDKCKKFLNGETYYLKY